MSVTTQVYTLGKMRQLIDLNGDIRNFKTVFSATSEGGESFEAVVVDQETLDNGSELTYRNANGSISGTVNSDSGVYQNYFLVLKSDNPVKCTVKLEISEIPQRSAEQPVHTHNDPTPAREVVSRRPRENFHNGHAALLSEKKGWGWKPYLIILVLVIGGFLTWHFYKKGSRNKEPILKEEQTPPIVATPVVETAPEVLPKANKKSLLDRLNNVKL